MPHPSVLVTKQARVDLEEIASFIARDNVDAALRFIDAFEVTGRRLADSPDVGVLRSFIHESLTSVRSFAVSGFANYIIFYRAVDSGIEIIRILHGARDIDSTFNEI